MFCLRSLLTVMLMYLKLRFTYNLSLIIVSPSFVFINFYFFFFFKQKTASDMRISDWSSDVCSSDLRGRGDGRGRGPLVRHDRAQRGVLVVHREELLLRHQRAREAPAVPPELRWPPQALPRDRAGEGHRLRRLRDDAGARVEWCLTPFDAVRPWRSG